MGNVRNIEVRPDESGLRLDRWFRSHFPNVSHGQLQKLLRTGQVRLNGHRVKANARLEAGQLIRVPPTIDVDGRGAETRNNRSTPRERRDPRDDSLLLSRIVYQDDFVIVIDKPAGLATQGGSKVKRHVDGLLDTIQFGASVRPKLVHRLDKDTSGLLVVARDRQTANFLTSAFKSRDVRKLYWALCVGRPSPESGRIDAPLAKQRSSDAGREKMAIDWNKGDAAITLYSTISTASSVASWIALEPQTGRTHQLRAHLAILDTPILGDRKYGGIESSLPMKGLSEKLHLHARGLRMPLPNGRMIEARAGLPPHMKKTWDELGFDMGDNNADEFLSDW